MCRSILEHPPAGLRCNLNVHLTPEMRETKRLARNARERELYHLRKSSSAQHSPKNPKVHAINVDPFSLVEDPPKVESGTILKAKDGTLVLISDNLTYSEYSGYIIGNLSNEPVVAEQLHTLDPHKKYQEGECDSLSFALLEHNPDIVAVDEIVNENGEMWHSVARHKDGYYIDSLGKWNEQDLFNYWDSISDREDENGFAWNSDVHEQGTTPNFKPADDLKPLLNYLNTLIT